MQEVVQFGQKWKRNIEDMGENVTRMRPDVFRLPRVHVTILQVAKAANVGSATVSRVLNKGQVSPTTRARVMEAIENLGYHPDAVARGLRSRVTKTIGFIVNDVSNPLFAQIMRGAAQAVRGEGYNILLGTSDDDPACERTQIRLLLSRRVDGMILSLVSDVDPEARLALESLSIPFVLIDREAQGVRADAVLCDHETGWTQATTYLLAIGHRRIALLLGHEITRPYRERMAAFQKAFETHRLAVPLNYVRRGPASAEFGERAMAELLMLPEPPTAVMACSNQVAIGALGILRAKRIAIPQQMSLIVADDVDVARLNAPAITVVARDMTQIGSAAGRLLIERLTQFPHAPERHIILPTQLIVRDSCAPPVAS